MARHRSTTAARRPGAPARAVLAGHLDRRANGLNLVRLLLPSSVVFWHAYPLRGQSPVTGHFTQLLSDGAVDGFFAISGFLLAGSWTYRPDVIGFFTNRALRILPGFWVCLVVVAVGFAPLTTLARGGAVQPLMTGPHSMFAYVTDNSLLWMRFYDVAGTPAHVPYAAQWNGSLWTLRWEAFVYIALAVAGVTGLLRRRRLMAGLLALMIAATLVTTFDHPVANYWISTGLRLGLMFLVGVVLSLFADVIPARRDLAAVSALVVLAACFTSDYRSLAAVPFAYLLVWVGGAIRSPALRLTDRDISYGVYIYAFPVEQTLAMTRLREAPAPAFAVVALAATVPLAVLSWVLVERPMLRLKGRLRRTRSISAGFSAPEAG